MKNERLFVGLFQRLHGSGLHAVLSGELAGANYPTEEHRPMRAVRCRQEAVHMHTEAYLDQGSTSLDETWLSIWGMTPLQYMGVDPASPAAREFGLADLPTIAGWQTSANLTTETAPLVEAPAFAEAFWLANSGALRAKYSGVALPKTAPPMARYFADLMCGLAHGFPGGVDDIRKGQKRFGFYPKPPEGWWDDMTAAGIALAIRLLLIETECNLLITTGEVGDYYRNTLARTHTDLSKMLGGGTMSSEEVAQETARIVTALSGNRGVRLKLAGRELELEVATIYLSARRSLDGAWSTLPLTMTEALGKLPKTGRPDAAERPPPATRNENITVGSLAESEPVIDNYEQWTEFCLEMADRRGVPRRFVQDLLPEREAADWSRKPLHQYESYLNEAVSGRRQWLGREGVTQVDFDRFWSRPPWVQSYIESFATRHFEMEVQAHVDMGTAQQTAVDAAAAFLPLYKMRPPEPDEADVFVPFELFDRVESYWPHLDDEDLNHGVVDEGWRTAKMRIQSEIIAGNL